MQNSLECDSEFVFISLHALNNILDNTINVINKNIEKILESKNKTKIETGIRESPITIKKKLTPNASFTKNHYDYDFF